jgi:hypothetical protein
MYSTVAVFRRTASLEDRRVLSALFAALHVGTGGTPIHPPTSRDQRDSTRLGLFQENKQNDVAHLVSHFTAPSLAKALRDREDTLQLCAVLAQKGDLGELMKILSPFLKENVQRKRRRARPTLDISSGFVKNNLTVIQRLLHRQPREVAQSARRRASVMIPLCNVNGVSAVLFERRSATVRTHKSQVSIERHPRFL